MQGNPVGLITPLPFLESALYVSFFICITSARRMNGSLTLGVDIIQTKNN